MWGIKKRREPSKLLVSSSIIKDRNGGKPHRNTYNSQAPSGRNQKRSI
jgi:hypothetical protein